MSAGSSPALLIHFPAGTSAATRDDLVALLADYDLVAIQEDQISAPTAWTAHFGSDDARGAAAALRASALAKWAVHVGGEPMSSSWMATRS